MSLKKFIVRFDLYHYEALCLIGDRAAAERFCLRYFGDVFAGSIKGDGAVMAVDGVSPVLWLPRFPRDGEGYGDLAHEALHLVEIMMQNIGMKLSSETCEAFCYAVGHVVEKVLEHR